MIYLILFDVRVHVVPTITDQQHRYLCSFVWERLLVTSVSLVIADEIDYLRDTRSLEIEAHHV